MTMAVSPSSIAWRMRIALVFRPGPGSPLVAGWFAEDWDLEGVISNSSSILHDHRSQLWARKRRQ